MLRDHGCGTIALHGVFVYAPFRWYQLILCGNKGTRVLRQVIQLHPATGSLNWRPLDHKSDTLSYLRSRGRRHRTCCTTTEQTIYRNQTSCRPGGCETICSPPQMAVRLAADQRIHVRPLTGPQSAYAKLQAASVPIAYGRCTPRAAAPRDRQMDRGIA